MKNMPETMAKALQEEMDGAVKYHEMANVEKAEGHEAEYVCIMAIARDEMTHAEWIHEYMKEKGVEIPAELEKKYMQLKSAHTFQ